MRKTSHHPHATHGRKKQVSAYVWPETAERLDGICERLKLSRAAAIQMALIEFINRIEEE